MRSSHKHVAHDRLRHLNPIRARLLQVFGPADSWDSPLAGSKYDPVVRQHEQQDRREARQARRAERKHTWHVADAETEHHNPDEV